MSKEVDAMLTGLTSNASVSIATSPGSITCSLCFVVMSETQEMELHDAEEVAMDVLECQRPSKAYATTYKG